jgi:hypothetical protein
MRALIGGMWFALTWSGAANAADPAVGSYSVPYHQDVTREEESVAEVALSSKWYGWQILVSDVASVTVFVAGVGTDGTEGAVLIWGGVAGYLVAPPFIHVANDQPDESASSVGLRMAAPIVGFYLGGLVGGGASRGCDGAYCQAAGTVAGAGIGFIVGVATAITIDATVFANKPVLRERAAISIAPSVAATPKAVFAGLRGTF